MRYWSIIFFMFPVFIFSQNWTLQQCIDTALLNNLSIQKLRNNVLVSEINVKTAKYDVLPSVNGGATHGYNWGQTIDPFTNEFATNRVQYNNFYINSNVVLFSGLQNYYGVKVKEVDYQSQLLNQDIEERNLKMKVLASYMQVLLNNELFDVAIEQLNLTKIQKERMELLVEAENKPENSLLEIEAQIALDNYNITKAQNDLNYALLLLQQLLNVPYSEFFNILKIDSSLIFQINQDLTQINTPELQLSNLNIKKAELQIKTVKARYYPTLNLNGSLGSGYSENRTFFTNGEFIPKPFSDQFKENFYQSASISLNIPIFNKSTTRHQVQINQLELKQTLLDKEQQKIEVRNKLEQLRMDVSNAQAQYQSAESVYLATKKSFENRELEHENGKVTYSQLMEEKNRLFKAKSELIQARYLTLFKQLVYNVYTEY